VDIAEEVRERLPAQAAAAGAAPVAEKFRAAPVITVAAGHWIHDSYTAFLPPLLIIFKQNLGLTNAAAGLLGVFMQGGALAQPVIGGLADVVNMRLFVILAPAVTGMCMSLLGLTTNYWTLAAFLLVVGLSSACLHAVGPVLVANASGTQVGTGMSFWMVGGEAGRFFGPVVLAAALPLLTLHRTPWLAIGGLITALLLFFALPADIATRKRAVGERLSLRQVVAGKESLVVVIVGFTLAQVFMTGALSTYLPLLMNSKGETFSQATLAFALYEAAGVLGAFLGGTLSDRLGRRWMLLAAIVPTAVFMFVFLGSLGQPAIAWVRIPALMVLGLATLSISPVIMALVQAGFPEHRALANGAYMAFSFLSQSLIVLLLGALGDWLGLPVSFGLSAVLPLASLPLLMFVPGKAAVSGARPTAGSKA
jgi:MFS transporter, FSR family, fosmidomycin resistance protein